MILFDGVFKSVLGDMNPGVAFNVPEVVRKFNVSTNLMDKGVRERVMELIADTPVMLDHGPLLGGSGLTAAAMAVEDIPVIILNVHEVEAGLAYSEGETLLEVISHEQTHVEQMRDKRLIVNNLGGVVFDDVFYPVDEINPFKREYLDLPWEKEAYKAGINELVQLGSFESVECGWESLLAHYATFTTEADNYTKKLAEIKELAMS